MSFIFKVLAQLIISSLRRDTMMVPVLMAQQTVPIFTTFLSMTQIDPSRMSSHNMTTP